MPGFFDKLFKRRSSIAKSPTTPEIGSELSQPTPAVVSREMSLNARSEMHFDPPQMLVGCGHSVGKQRDHNEDALFTLTTTLVTDNQSIPFGLYIVADGMGGHKHGEMASGSAIRAMSSHIIRKLYLPLFNMPASNPEEPLQDIMQEGIQAAHRAIIKHTTGGGTTLTAVLILGNQMTITHVGDSRAYTIQLDGKTEILTRDHSFVKRLEELGQLTSDEAAIHPQRNVLYRALGQGDIFDAEISTSPVPKSGYLLLCSDGLWGVLQESEIINIIFSTPSPAVACQRLVEAANAAGGPDNITALLVRLPD